MMTKKKDPVRSRLNPDGPRTGGRHVITTTVKEAARLAALEAPLQMSPADTRRYLLFLGVTEMERRLARRKGK